MFSSVTFFECGRCTGDTLEQLAAGGARKFRFLSSAITHCIAGADPEPEDLEQATQLWDITVVTEEWVNLSTRCGSLLPEGGFNPLDQALLRGLVLLLDRASLTPADVARLWAMVSWYGGRTVEDASLATHLVTTSSTGLERGTSCHVVTPDWLLHSIQEKQLKNEKIYNPVYLVEEKVPELDVTKVVSRKRKENEADLNDNLDEIVIRPVKKRIRLFEDYVDPSLVDEISNDKSLSLFASSSLYDSRMDISQKEETYEEFSFGLLSPSNELSPTASTPIKSLPIKHSMNDHKMKSNVSDNLTEEEIATLRRYIQEEELSAECRKDSFWISVEKDGLLPGRSWRLIKQKYFASNLTIYTERKLSSKKTGDKKVKKRLSAYYTIEEDKQIIEYIVSVSQDNHAMLSLKGNTFWKLLEEKQVLPGRTWQSLKNRFLKNVNKHLDCYGLSQAVQDSISALS